VPVALPHPGAGSPGPDPAAGDERPADAGSIGEQVGRARLQPLPGQVPVLATGFLSALVEGSQRPVSRVADLGNAALTALRLGRVTDCLAALAQQREAAGDDPAAQTWALTASSVCHAVFGQLGSARSDLAQAWKICNNRAPLLAEPFWRFAETMCNWLEGNWETALARATALDTSRAGPFSPGLAGTITALRMDMLRGRGLPRECRDLAGRLAAEPPAEMSAWALAGLDADEGRRADALRRLADVCDVGTRGVYRTAMPLVLHRMAEIAFACGDGDVTAYTADALAGLEQVAPLNEILTGLAQAYAARDPEPARRALQRAEAEGAGMLAAEALTVLGQIGDEPATSMVAAHAAWSRVGAPAKARAVAAAMRAAGLPAPVPRRRVARASATDQAGRLTARERALARLVHEGRTNQQIARSLHISVKTVEAYLTRLYRKTSCSSRVELAVAVTEGRIEVGD
jgi:DNA-binding CsgD family transcriptional regulator